MNNQVQELINNLETAVTRDDFVDRTYEVVDKLIVLDDAFDAIAPILRLMENYPNVEYGRPGPLVHFVERYYKKGYEEKLIDSLKRRPTKHTVWMLNRIINGSQGKTREYYVALLEELLKYPSLEQDVLELIIHFIEINQ